MLEVADDRFGADTMGGPAEEAPVVHDPDDAAPVGDGPDLGVVDVAPRPVNAAHPGVGDDRWQRVRAGVERLERVEVGRPGGMGEVDEDAPLVQRFHHGPARGREAATAAARPER